MLQQIIIAPQGNFRGGYWVHWDRIKQVTYSPFAFCEVLPDLGTDRLMDVFVEGCVPSDPETKAKMLL